MSDNTNNGFPVPEEPLTREEQYLSAIAGVTEATEIPEIPLTRVEAYLNKIVEEGGDITDKLEAGTNIVIEETADGKAKISASGEVSSEDTYARGEIQAILDGTTIDSFGDVEIALADKVDKVEGKGLSANDFTDTLKTKLDGIAAGAEVNVQADWNQTTDTADDYIKNKPTIPAAQVNSDWNAASGVAQILNKPTLGTAAAAATTDFATAAQGTKADSAIQGVKVGSTTLTPDSGKAVTITKNDITGLGIPAQDTTYEFESTYNASTNKAATMADIKNGVLTGYAQSSGNVAATDKVIEAIGKVEKKADTNESNILSLTPTAYTQPTADTDVTIASGGYCKVGNLCIVCIRCTVSSAFSQNARLFSQLPQPVADSSLSASAVIPVTNNLKLNLMIAGTGELKNYDSTAIAANDIVVLSAVYLAKQ